jgi:hypothetical protein
MVAMATLGTAPEAVMSGLHAFLQTSGLLPLLARWQSLIAGLLGLLAGIIAFVGALIAAYWQVKAARQTAADQVAAVQSQLDDVRTAREEDEKHKREIERAYVSGGGARNMARNPNGRPLFDPTDLFELHINNHGKTPAYLHHVAIGFCDASALPPEPVYDDLFPWRDAIGPGVQSRRIRTVNISGYARVAICGRYYWDDIWGRHWSSGFVYEIPSRAALIDQQDNTSISIEAPPAYWDDRPGDYPADV